MPIYEYKCKTCGCDFEKLVAVSSEDQINCPQCASDKIAKKISMIASGKSGCGTTCASTSCGPS